MMKLARSLRGPDIPAPSAITVYSVRCDVLHLGAATMLGGLEETILHGGEGTRGGCWQGFSTRATCELPVIQYEIGLGLCTDDTGGWNAILIAQKTISRWLV